MSSPITFSGFNNIDFSSILTAMMAQESQPVQALQSQQSALTTQKSNYSTLASKLSTLEDAIKRLSTPSEFGGKTATSTDSSAVAVTADASAPQGNYDVVVDSLARSQTTASATTFTDKDQTIVASSGTLVINGTAVTVTQPATLQDLASAINNDDNLPVTASVVSVTPGSFQLVLTGKSSGTANAFTVQNNLTGGAGIAFTDTDGDGKAGNSSADNAQDAVDASFTVNNIAITSSSNTVDSVIPGVTLQLLRKDPNNTISVSVTRDQDAAKTQIKSFVSAFNDLMSFANDQSKAAAGGDQSSIGRDALLRGLRNSLRTAFNTEYSTTGSKFTYASQMGLGFAHDGSLTFDEDQFDTATQSGNSDVTKLFAGAGGAGGLFTSMQTLVNSYTDAGGLLPNANDRLDAQLKSLGDRIDSMNARLAIERDSLSKQFTATDSTISALNNSIQSLSSLNNQYRLF